MSLIPHYLKIGVEVGHKVGRVCVGLVTTQHTHHAIRQDRFHYDRVLVAHFYEMGRRRGSWLVPRLQKVAYIPNCFFHRWLFIEHIFIVNVKDSIFFRQKHGVRCDAVSQPDKARQDGEKGHTLRKGLVDFGTRHVGIVHSVVQFVVDARFSGQVGQREGVGYHEKYTGVGPNGDTWVGGDGGRVWNQSFHVLNPQMHKPVGAHRLTMFDQDFFLGVGVGFGVEDAAWKNEWFGRRVCLAKMLGMHVDAHHHQLWIPRQVAVGLTNFHGQVGEPKVFSVVLACACDSTQSVKKVPVVVQFLKHGDRNDFAELVHVPGTKRKGI